MVSIEELKKNGRFIKSLSKLNKSNIYLYDDILYKVFNDYKEFEFRENMLKQLYEKPIDDCSKICSLLYNGSLIGYGMEYYKKYKVLKNVKKINYELKKNYCHKIINVYNNLKKLGYIYYDFHELNILVNKENLRLIDIDSCIPISDKNDLLATKYLNELILSLLFDCNFFDKQMYFDKPKRCEIQNILYSDLSYNYNKIGSLDELDKYVENITDKKIKSIKKRLPKNVLK